MGRRRKAAPTAETPDDLTPSEVASLLHVSEATLERMVRTGRFPPPTRHGGAGDRIWPRRVVLAYRVLAPLLPDLFRLPPRQSKDPEK